MKYSVAIFTAVISATILISCADILHAQKVRMHMHSTSISYYPAQVQYAIIILHWSNNNARGHYVIHMACYTRAPAITNLLPNDVKFFWLVNFSPINCNKKHVFWVEF